MSEEITISGVASPVPWAGCELLSSQPDSLAADGGRLSALCAALLRLGASLDLKTVLCEVADSARALTGARYAAIVTIDAGGTPQDFVTSGMTSAEHRSLEDWSEGPEVFEYFRDLEGPLRIEDAPVYVRELGFAVKWLPSDPFEGMPMRHRGEHVGNFYLVGKEGGAAFTNEDEEILALFASQAAAAIANARLFEAERRARADLEALVEISPVGVAVFDVASGAAVSLNREGRRLAEAVRQPGRTAEDMLGALTYRLADGSEFAMSELPLPGLLSVAEAARGEEVVLSNPEDGRSVTVLINAAPIPGDDGTPDTLVVTLQDLAPIEELERTRAEFVEMVSHELRMPLISIKGSTSTVLGATRPFAPTETGEFFRIIDEQADRMMDLIADLLDAGHIRTGTLSVAAEPSDAGALIEEARSAFLAGGGRHTVQIDLPQDTPRAMADRRRIVQVLNNLLANAARHAPEATPIRVAAARNGVHVEFSVADEGSGIPPERLSRVFRKYAAGPDGDGPAVPGTSGLGLAICKGLVEAHGGRIWAESAGAGLGARFTFSLPVADETSGGRGIPSAERAQDAERILIVDDDPRTLRHVRDALTNAGYVPLAIGNHHELAEIIRIEAPDLVLLDLVLPGADGIELLEEVPELTDIPVIFISAYGAGETIARALDVGAADYIVKPFSSSELTARIRAVLRRRAGPESFVLGDLSIDYDRRVATLAGRPVTLTATEFDLLRALALEAGRVLTFETLLRRVWRDRGKADEKVVRAFVKQLRRKLGDDAGNPAYIFNVRGVGYRMASPQEGEPP